MKNKMNKTKSPAKTKAVPMAAKDSKATVVSRTTIVKAINNTKGQFFTSTHIGKDGKPHTMNCIRYKNQNNDLGYISVFCPKDRTSDDKGLRFINPQTVTAFKGCGLNLKARK